MATGSTRRRWFAVLVPALLLGLLAGAGGSSGASGTDVLRLDLGVAGAIDGFHWNGDRDQGGLVQPLTESSCVVDSPSGSPQLVTMSATKTSDRAGAVAGRDGNALGVKGTSENVGSVGAPCGEIDYRETLTLALGPDLVGKRAVSGELRLLPRPGPSVDPVVELLEADGTVVRSIDVPPINAPTTVTIPAGSPFHQVRLGSVTRQDNRAFGLASGSYLQLEDQYRNTVDCEADGTPIPPPPGDIGVDIRIVTSTAKDDGPCSLPYNLESSISPTEGRRVLFEFPEIGWDLTFRWHTAWTEEPANYPVPPTKISVDGGLTFVQMELCNGQGSLPAGLDWCLEQQTVTARPGGMMQVTDVIYGRGDPISLR